MSKTIVTVRYESDAPYTDGERLTLVEAISDTVMEIDGDAHVDSFTIVAMTEAEEKEAQAKQVKDILESSMVSATVSISNGSIDMAVILVEDEDA